MKSLLTGLFCVVSLGFCQAQAIRLGVKAGANMYKIDGQSFNNSYNLGYNGGLFVEIHTGKKFYIAPELLFNQVNLETNDEFSDIWNGITLREVFDIRLQQLSIPVTFNYKIANVLALSAGPVFTINMQEDVPLTREVEQAFTKGDIGLLGGANVHIGKLRVSGRYIVGIRNQNKTTIEDSWQSNQWQFGLGFVF